MNWHEFFTYDAEAGRLVWKRRPPEHFKSGVAKSCNPHASWNTKWAGKNAGCTDSRGYWVVSIAGAPTKMAHRIIWEMHHGPIPEGMDIDHVNGNPSDNRLDNLRISQVHQNLSNRVAQRNNQLGLKGVSKHKRGSGRYVSQITVNGRYVYVGCFPTKGGAAVAYAKASLRYHGKFSPFYRKTALSA